MNRLVWSPGVVGVPRQMHRGCMQGRVNVEMASLTFDNKIKCFTFIQSHLSVELDNGTNDRGDL